MNVYEHEGNVYLFSPYFGEVGPITPQAALALASMVEANEVEAQDLSTKLRAAAALAEQGEGEWPEDMVVSLADGNPTDDPIVVRIAY